MINSQKIRYLTWRSLNVIKKLILLLIRLLVRLINSGLHQPRKVLAVIILLVSSSALLVALFWYGGSHNFEGNLLVQEMSFTYNEKQENKLFLNNIRGIKQLDWEGKQTIALNGKFSSQSNSKLSQLNYITIQLPYAKSRLIITPVTSDTPSKIQLNELRLQPNTEVSDLTYNSAGNVLSFCLQASSKKDNFCLQPDFSLAKSSQSKTENVGQLQLELGRQPLKITIEGYDIPQLGKKDSPDNPQSFDFVFTPVASQIKLNLITPTNLYLSLPELAKENSSQWMRGNLAVKNVKLFRFDRTGNVEDELKDSTILKGEIRMAEQELKIQPNQLLLIGEPGIELLRYFQIQSKPTPGLQLRFSGKSQKIEVGLDSQFIVNSIQPNFLANYLSKDAIAVLLSFCAAVIGALLPLLFANAFESQSKH